MVGFQIWGVNFWAPHLYIADSNWNNELGLKIESGMHIFKEMPGKLPPPNLEITKASDQFIEENVIAIWKLSKNETKIKKVELGENTPHIFITFEDGQVLFINGYHPKYECWELSSNRKDFHYTLVACPDNQIDIWAPDDLEPTE